MKRVEALVEARKRWGEHAWVRYRMPRGSQARTYEVGHASYDGNLPVGNRVMGAGPTWESALQSADKARALEAFTRITTSHGGRGAVRVGVIDGGARPPTLPQQAQVMALAKKERVAVVCWTWTGDGCDQHTTRLRRCDCGEVAINDDACRICRALAPLIVSQDPDSAADLDARRAAAERYMDRLAAVLEELTRQNDRMPGGRAAP